MKKRILITGSRDWFDQEKMWGALDKYLLTFLPEDDMIIVHGDARGADRMAKKWAIDRGVEYEDHPADWDKHPKAAGPIRNREMLKLGADVVLAFPLPASIGTYDMIKIAEKAGVFVKVIE
jgi:hypothetical protein